MSMTQPISLQTAQLLWSAALGLGLGCFYDLLRAMRRSMRLPSAAADGLFVLLVCLSLLLLAYYAGLGQFQLYMLLGVFCGAAFYFLLLSPWILRGLSWIFELFGHVLTAIAAPFLWILKKYKKICKKVFQSVKKWFKIKLSVIGTVKRGTITTGGTVIEVETIPPAGQASGAGSGGVRRSYPAVTPSPAPRRSGRDRSPAKSAQHRIRRNRRTGGSRRRRRHG